MTHTLTQVLGKDVPYLWTESHQRAFKGVKTCLQSHPIGFCQIQENHTTFSQMPPDIVVEQYCVKAQPNQTV